MSKKNQTTQERKQALETCIRKLEEIELVVQKLYPRVGNEIQKSLYTNDERAAVEYFDCSAGAFCYLSTLWSVETRKEVTNE